MQLIVLHSQYMNIPDQIHFDRLDPDDFEFQHWLLTAQASTLCEVSALIERTLKDETQKFRKRSRLRARHAKGKALVEAIHKQLQSRIVDCETRASKMQVVYDMHVFSTATSRWSSRRRTSRSVHVNKSMP